MQIIVGTVIGLVVWIVLWAFDVKALDSFLLAVAIVLVATLVWMMGPFIKSVLRP